MLSFDKFLSRLTVVAITPIHGQGLGSGCIAWNAAMVISLPTDTYGIVGFLPCEGLIVVCRV
jgi:hypothetical protein